MTRLGPAAVALLLLAAAPSCGGVKADAVGTDPVGDLRYFGNRSPWEFMDIVEFGASVSEDEVEGYLEFLYPPLDCPSCTFTIEFAEPERTVVVEFDTHLEAITRRSLSVRGAGGAPVDGDFYPVAEEGRRLEFRVPVGVAPGATMTARSFHDERGGQNDKAIDVTDTPLVLAGAGG